MIEFINYEDLDFFLRAISNIFCLYAKLYFWQRSWPQILFKFNKLHITFFLRVLRRSLNPPLIQIMPGACMSMHALPWQICSFYFFLTILQHLIFNGFSWSRRFWNQQTYPEVSFKPNFLITSLCPWEGALNVKKAIFFMNFLNILGDAVAHTNLRDLRGKGKKETSGGS